MHYLWLADDGVLLADTQAIALLQTYGWCADHLGFGDFRLSHHEYGKVDFIRKDGGNSPPSWPGMVGRPHQVYGLVEAVGYVMETLNREQV